METPEAALSHIGGGVPQCPVLITLLLACASAPAPVAPTPPSPSPAVVANATIPVRPRPTAPSGVRDDDRALKGIALMDLQRHWGTPAEDRQFTLGDFVSEREIELLNDFPAGPARDAQAVRELTWKYADYEVVVWFYPKPGGWLAAQAVTYTDDVEF